MKLLSIIIVLCVLACSCDSKVKIKSTNDSVSTDTAKWQKATGENISFLFPKEFAGNKTLFQEGLRFKIDPPNDNYENGWIEIYELKNVRNMSFANFIYGAQEFYQEYIGKEGDPRVYNNVKDEFHGMPAQRIELNVKTASGDILTTCLLLDAGNYYYLINYTKSKDEGENELIDLILKTVKISPQKNLKNAQVIKKN